MSEEPKDVSSQAVGQSQEISGGAPEAQSPGTGEETAPKYFTRDEAERYFTDIQEYVKRVQSVTDKAATRIDKGLKATLDNVNKIIEMQKRAGIDLTPDQIRAVRMQAYDDVFSAQEPDRPDFPLPKAAQPGPVDGVNQAQAAVVAFVNKQADKMMKKAGVELDASDPEASMLVQDKGPDEYLDSLEAALQKKAQRVKTPPEARIPTLGSGAATNLEAQYKAELEKVRQGDVDGLFKLKQKYKKAGLTNI